MHITDRERCNWLRARIETPEQFKYSPKKKLHILDRLSWAEMFEGFLANKYSAAKRFGLEGCEALIPGMKAFIDEAADRGMESVVIGMPHRGGGQQWPALLCVLAHHGCWLALAACHLDRSAPLQLSARASLFRMACFRDYNQLPGLSRTPPQVA